MKVNGEYVNRKEDFTNSITEIIKEVLDVDDINNDLPFIELGMESLDVPFFIKRLEKEFNCEVPVTSVFENSTVHSYSEYLYTLLSDPVEADDELNEQNEQSKTRDTVGIIGMSCRFPGGANNPDRYWDNLIRNVDGISTVPESRWDIDEYYSENKKESGKMYTKKGGFLNVPIDEFDAAFFNISPKEAQSLDPQQRLLLELTWEAFESAGLNVFDYKGSNTGVYVGIAGEEYSLAHYKSGDLHKIDAYSLTGTTFSTACGRLSYTFGFEGPSMSVDTACSSSLTAMHLACKALQNHEIDLAIVAGVNLMISPSVHVCFSKIEAISTDGHCKTFDEAADGYSRSEGGGVLILKRTEEAKADHDSILGIVSGSAVNQDGKSNGLTAPNGASQEKLIKKALKDAGLNEKDIGYIEMHGTGTKLGDPIEVNAVINSYGKLRNQEDQLKIGSVKSNIGHLEAAAGIASIIKVLLGFKHSTIPANLNFNTPNPFIDWEKSSIHVVNQNMKWTDPIKRAGINGFGFGGSNAHIILTESDNQVDEETASLSDLESGYILKLTGKTSHALETNGLNSLNFIKENPQLSLDNITYTNNSYKSDFSKRVVITGDSRNDLIQNLDAYVNKLDSDGVFEETNQVGLPKLVFMYSGQGSQYVGMGKELYTKFKVFRSAFDTCSTLFMPYLDQSLTELIYSGSFGDEFIANTGLAQPLIFSIEYALDQLWDDLNIRPDIVIGHSIGEYAAAVRADILTLEDAVRLLATRATLMASLPGGSMVSIFANKERVEDLIQGFEHQVSIAVINSLNNIVVSGEKDAIESIIAEAKRRKIKANALHVSHAFHSKMMVPIVNEFHAIASSISFKTSRVEFISTKLGRTVREDEILDAEYWSKHITDTVDFHQGMECLKEKGNVVCLEIGSAKVLSLLGKLTLGDDTSILSSMDRKTNNVAQLFSCVGELYCNGFPIKWKKLYNDKHRKVQLPTYAYDKKSYWLKPNHQLRENNNRTQHSILGQKIVTPLLKDTFIYQNTFNSSYPYFMKEHIIFDHAIAPAAAHLSMLFLKTKDFRGSKPLSIENVEFYKPIITGKDEQRTVQYVFKNVADETIDFSLMSMDETVNENWSEHCKARLNETNNEYNENKTVAISELEKMYPENQSGYTVYDVMSKYGFNLGSGFTRITKVWNNNKGGVCRIDPWDELPVDEKYEIYPGTVDSILQSLLAVSELSVKMNSDTESYAFKTAIPISIGKVIYYYREAKTLWCHVTADNSQKDGVLGNIEVYNEKGEIVMEIQNLLAVLTDRRTILKGLEGDASSLLYDVQWKETKKTEPFSNQVKADQHYLLLSGNDRLADALSDRLGFHGCNYTVVSVEKLSELNSKEKIKQLVASLVDKESGKKYKLLYIPAKNTEKLENIPGEIVTQAIEKSNSDVLHIIQAISELSVSDVLQMWIVTQHALGLSNEDMDVVQSMLWGFANVIRLEYPALWGGIIDHCAGYEELDMDYLITELNELSNEQVVLLENHKRLVPRLEKYKVESQKEAFTIQSDASYVISGGTGGIGLTYAEFLINNGAKNLILLSRKGATGETLEKIEQWTKENVHVVVKQIDVSAPFQVDDLIDPTLPPVKGIIHAAGTLSDKMIADQDWENFEKVFSGKVLGAINLHHAFSGYPLDFFIMMSSIASLIGNIGQSNYAAANYMLNALAEYRKSMNLPALSICWGPWADMGMAASDQENLKRIATRGIFALPLDRCEKVMEQLFHVSKPYVMAADINWNLLNEKTDHLEVSNFLSKVTTNSAEVRTKANNVEQAMRISVELEKLNHEERHEFLLARLKSVISTILGYTDDESIQVDIPITEQGADSLMIFSMKTEITKLTKVDIDISVFYNYPTLVSINDYILKQMFPETNSDNKKKKDEDESVEDLLLEINSLID
ncbi:type I polyketide synthase [Paucisalibacillus globulus]|uniref:type I polyketide synthase n=1 Tax=Paucisalibacillus globulus TaxID=351095 RepID=UPI00047C6B40|nr:type I polyketide synthase [Paucisalibacillus globulus]